MKHLLFALVFSFYGFTELKAQTIQKDLEVAKNSQMELQDSIYVVENFILNENSTLTFHKGLSTVKINCKTFTADKGSKIIGKGQGGTVGAVGTAANRNGSPGTAGTNGVNFIKVCDVFSFCDFTADLSGGNGGTGGNGIKGKKGRNGSCCTHEGGNGGTGGSGGKGGGGGTAGDFKIIYKSPASPCNTTINSQNFTLKGGKGGALGTGGSGGDGGNRASGCFPGCNRRRGSRGSTGRNGIAALSPKDKTITVIQD